MLEFGAVGWKFVVRYHATAKGTNPVAMRMRTPEASQEEPKELKLNETFAAPETRAAQPVSLPKPTPISQAPQKAKQSPAQGRLNELTDQARALRDRGDMSTALVRLREAQALSPDNPMIISEIAITYEKMGMKDKALEQWRRIFQMGEGAGIYYSAADAKLKTGETPARTGTDGTAGKEAGSEGFQPGSVLALVDISKVDSPDGGDKKFTLRIPLKKRADAKIDVHDVVIQVFFYDLIEDRDVVQTNANMTYHWATVPVDWSENDIEILEVDYAASPPSPKEKHPENRRYFGYIVRVYYKNELQDMRAEPVKLLKQYPPPLTLASEESK